MNPDLRFLANCKDIVQVDAMRSRYLFVVLRFCASTRVTSASLREKHFAPLGHKPSDVLHLQVVALDSSSVFSQRISMNLHYIKRNRIYHQLDVLNHWLSSCSVTS